MSLAAWAVGAHLFGAAAFFASGLLVRTARGRQPWTSPLGAFTLWWWLLGLIELLRAAHDLSVAGGFVDAALRQALVLARLAALLAAVASLAWYVANIYLERPPVPWRLLGVYLFLGAWMTAAVASTPPAMDADAAHHLFGGVPRDVQVGIVGAILAPTLLLSVGYARLGVGIARGRQRRRHLMVSLSLLLWLAGFQTGALGWDEVAHVATPIAAIFAWAGTTSFLCSRTLTRPATA